MLEASLSFGFLSLMDDELQQLGKHVAAAAGFSSNFMLWSESGYFDTPTETKILLHLWSLGIEEQFYIFWPLLLVLFRKSRAGMVSIMFLGAATSLALNWGTVQTNSSMAFYFPQSRFWELLAGSLLAYWMPRPYGYPKGIGILNVISITGLGLMACGVFVINKNIPYPGTWALIPVVGACLIIRAGPESWPNRHLFSNRLMVNIRLISYPLYLWHWPLLAFAGVIESRTPTWEIRSALLLLATGLAWGTFRFIERPIRTHQGTPSARLLAIGLLAIGVIGYLASLLPNASPRPKSSRR